MRSRRKFTKEFKEAAVRRLELGATMAEVARAGEVSPNVLHRWRRELREQGGKAFPGEGQRRLEVTAPLADLERKIGRVKHWRSIFGSDACSMSRSGGGCRH